MYKIFKHKSELSFEQATIIAYNLLIALNYVHKAGVIHRDLKPNNVLINPFCQVFLCDFGWARTLPDDDQVRIEGKQKRSLTTDFCSRYYRPPEVILNLDNYDYRADVWSYGCIVAELFKYAINLEKGNKHLSSILF